MRAATLLVAAILAASTVPASGRGLAATASIPTRPMAELGSGLDLRLTPDIALERAQRLDGVLGAGASTSTSTRAAGTDTAVLGTIKFTDRDGALHPARRAKVQLLELTTPNGEKELGTDTTDNSGRYRIPIGGPRAASDVAPANGYNVKVRAFAEGPGYSVRGSAGVYYVNSVPPAGPDPSAGIRVPNGVEKTINVDAKDTAADNNRAFSLADAMLDISDYTKKTGTQIPSLDVQYPSPPVPGCSCYIDGLLYMAQEDAFDYDTAHHEFAHFLMDQFNIVDTPGGDHGPPIYNLSERYRNKKFGIKLAWSEAWPTFYGIMLQNVVAAADRRIPALGDTWYDATNKNPMNGAIEQSRYDLEGETDAKGRWPDPASGEDNEFAVQRFLWDVYDDTPNEAGDEVMHLPDNEITGAFRRKFATSFSDAYKALVADVSDKRRAEIGCLAAQQEISPMITAPANGSPLTAEPPTITWVRNGGGPTYLNNSFVVEFYDKDFAALLYKTGDILVKPPAKGERPPRTESYVPGGDTWGTNIRGKSPAEVNIVVRGTQTVNSVTGQPASAVTGPYDSCALSLLKK